MKNNFIFKLKSKQVIIVAGKNINRFIIRLNNNNIEILDCKYLDKDKAKIIIYNKDLEKLKKIKTIYNIDIIDNHGIIKIKKKIKIHKFIIISLVLGIILLKILSSIIFQIDVVYNDKNIREFIKEELKKYGIKEKTFKKNFNEIKKIKEEILKKYKDKIEWIEIETKGIKYIVRLELRKINELNTKQNNQNIIAKKDGMIKEIIATKGQIIKTKNTYVKKGDIIISGNIYANEEVKDQVAAQGKVFAETWYEINVTYPFVYAETKETNDKKNIFAIKIFNKYINLFDKNPYKNKKTEEKIIIKNNILPILLVKQKQTKLEIIDEILTTDQVIDKALRKAKEEIEKKLNNEEYIINYKIVNTNIKENELELNVFFTVYEDITEYQEIVNEEKNTE